MKVAAELIEELGNSGSGRWISVTVVGNENGEGMNQGRRTNERRTKDEGRTATRKERKDYNYNDDDDGGGEQWKQRRRRRRRMEATTPKNGSNDDDDDDDDDVVAVSGGRREETRNGVCLRVRVFTCFPCWYASLDHSSGGSVVGLFPDWLVFRLFACGLRTHVRYSFRHRTGLHSGRRSWTTRVSGQVGTWTSRVVGLCSCLRTEKIQQSSKRGNKQNKNTE